MKLKDSYKFNISLSLSLIIVILYTVIGSGGILVLQQTKEELRIIESQYKYTNVIMYNLNNDVSMISSDVLYLDVIENYARQRLFYGASNEKVFICN